MILAITIVTMMMAMMIEMKAEEGEEEIEMIMKTQGEEQKGRESETEAGTMGQEEEHPDTEGHIALLLHQKCQV